MKNDAKITSVLWQIQEHLEEGLIFVAPEVREYYRELVSSLNSLTDGFLSEDHRRGYFSEHLDKLARVGDGPVDEVYKSFFVVKGLIKFSRRS
jgi:hypothetical protein